MHRRTSFSYGGLLTQTSKFALRYQSSSTHSKPPHIRKKPTSPSRTRDGFRKLTKRIIDHTAQEPKGRTIINNLVKALEDLQQRPKSSSPPSTQQMAFNAGEMPFEEEVGSGNDYTSPGTFIETRRNEVTVLGVVLEEVYWDRRARLVTLTTTGEIWMPVKQDISFSIPSLVPVNLALRCGTSPVATKDSELNARVEVLKRLRQLEKAAESACSSVSQQFTNVYDIVKSKDPNKWSTTTVAEVARLVSPKYDILTNFATHTFLMNNPTHFVASSYHATQVINVRPQSHVNDLQTVLEWSRLPEGPLHEFAIKARKVIEANRRIYNESHAEAPSRSPGNHTWSPNDKIILNFLLRALRPYRSTQIDPYSLGQSAILKRIDPKGPIANDVEVQKLLVNLAVLTPWQDIFMLTSELELDMEDETHSPRVKAQNDLVTRTLSSRPKQIPLGPEDFHMSDPLEPVRHDFGDLPVYVIDDAHAEELDDGISVERIPSEPGSLWIHVHIADPASVVPPSHIFAKEASKQGESIYFLQRSWSLFPRSLMHAPHQGLSLGSKIGAETRVLTFSAKVNAQGDVSEFKTRAGIVRNIKITSYDAVDLALDIPLTVFSYPFGGNPPQPSKPSFSKSQIQDLRDLYRTSLSLVERRFRNGVFVLTQNSSEIANFPRGSDIKSPTFEPSIFRGFPKFTYKVTSSSALDSGAHGMVAEMMKLACRAISLFCLERGVPVIRRTSSVPTLTSEYALQDILNKRSPNCYVPAQEALPYFLSSQPADYSLEPKGHFGLGVADGEGYVRGTSPLRRYADLVTHWQLHHALLGSSAPSKRPPFDAEQLEKLIVKIGAQDRIRSITTNHHEQYWKIMFIKRWMEETARGAGRRNDPLKTLKAFTWSVPKLNLTTRKPQVQVHIPKLGIRGLMDDIGSFNVPFGTLVPVNISETRLGIRPLLTFQQK